MGHEHGYQAGIEGCRFTLPNFQLKNSKDPSFDPHQQINLWKDDANFFYLYSNLECYLYGASNDALEEVP